MHRNLICFALSLLLSWGCGLPGSSSDDELSGLKTTRIPPVLVPGFTVCHEEFKCLVSLKNTSNQAQRCNLSMHAKALNSSSNEAYLWSDEVTGIEVEPDSQVRVTFNFRDSLTEIRTETADQSYDLAGPLPDVAAGRCDPATPEPDPDPVTVLPDGTPLQMTIHPGQTRMIRFSLTGQGPYIMETRGNLDTMMDLYTALNQTTPGSRLATDDNSGVSANARISEQLARGTYFLKVWLKSTFDSGSLQILVRPADSASGWCSAYSRVPEHLNTITLLQDMTGQQDCPGTYHALQGTDTIRLQDTTVKDLTPLREFTHIKRLYLMNSRVSNLDPVSGMTDLILLYFDRTAVSDLRPLKNMSKLKALGFPFTGVTELSPLYSLTSLGYIDMTGVQVSSDDINQLRMRLPNTAIRY